MPEMGWFVELLGGHDGWWDSGVGQWTGICTLVWSRDLCGTKSRIILRLEVLWPSSTALGKELSDSGGGHVEARGSKGSDWRVIQDEAE
jgi:hypothetical protein